MDYGVAMQVSTDGDSRRNSRAKDVSPYTIPAHADILVMYASYEGESWVSLIHSSDESVRIEINWVIYELQALV